MKTKYTETHVECYRIMQTLAKLDTVLTADSVEWCPCKELYHILACGTYQLDEKAGKRHGTLSLYEWDNASLTQVLQSETSSHSDGILDMKWHSVADKAILALAKSNGYTSFVHLASGSVGCDINMSYSLCDFGEVQVAGSDKLNGLCLSLDWNKRTSIDLPVIAVSDSLGQVSTIQLEQAGPRLLHQWKAHEFEAWIVSFGSEPHTLFSGGDDCRLCMWDMRAGFMKPRFTSKRHTMGVCSLHMNSKEHHLLATGSYDEILRLWDTRNMSQPLKEHSLGGGIWRIKWNTTHTDLAATACMHNGFNLVNCHIATSDPIEVLCGYNEHKSLAYGIDWCRQPDKTSAEDSSKKCLTLASSSFYDHAMHIWTIANV